MSVYDPDFGSGGHERRIWDGKIPKRVRWSDMMHLRADAARAKATLLDKIGHSCTVKFVHKKS
jgi:hypothetical protein